MSAVSRLDTLASVHPEWSAWLRVIRELAAELSNPAWDTCLPPTGAASDRVPVLAGATLRPDGLAVAQLMERLLSAARAQGLHALAGEAKSAKAMAADEALAVFLGAVNGEHTLLDEQASRIGASPSGFRALAELLPMPYLHACARQWATNRSGSNWSQGYCPVCGAWPALAEVRGIERVRHLRCGRCGAGWPMPALACTYCATTDHDTLGTLVVDDKLPRFAVDTCHGCSGYLKSFTTLQATPSDEIIALDLESVAFDLAAVERGFLRPADPGVALNASLDAAEAAPRALRRWWS